MRPRFAFPTLQAFAKRGGRVGRMRHHITSRLMALTSLPPQRCIENGSLIQL